MKLNHQHLILNAQVSNPPTNPEFIKLWLQQLVNLIGMKTIIGPHAHYCTAHDNEGLAAIVGIETSHISLHVWSNVPKPYLRFDIYSCTTFDIPTVIQHLNPFQPTHLNYLVLDRNQPNIIPYDPNQPEIPQPIGRKDNSLRKITRPDFTNDKPELS